MSKRDESINKPVNPDMDACYAIHLFGDRYGIGIEATRREFDEYNRDPDRFAANHFKCVSVAEYREWIHCNGIPYCSERTKRGPFCSCPVAGHATGGMNLEPEEWRALHRLHPCALHKTLTERAA